MGEVKGFNQHLKEDALVEDIIHFLDEGGRSNQVIRAPSVSKIIFANSGITNYQGLDKRAKNEWRLNVPITSALYKNIVKQALSDKGETNGTWIAYHVTTKESISDILRLQGKKKTISTFTSMHQSYLDNGVASGGGVVFMLAGDALVRGKSDIESLPDRGGRRWLNLDAIRQMDESVGKKLKSLFGKKLKGILDTAISKFKYNMLEEVIKNTPEWENLDRAGAYEMRKNIMPSELDVMKNGSRNAFGRWMFCHDILHEGTSWNAADGTIISIPQAAIGKCKSYAIKSYMDAVSEYLKYSSLGQGVGDDLGKAFIKYVGNKYVDQDIDYEDGDVGDYDEILMNNFRVLKCYYSGSIPAETEALLDRNSIDHGFFLSGEDLIGSIEGMGGFIEDETPESLQKDYQV